MSQALAIDSAVGGLETRAVFKIECEDQLDYEAKALFQIVQTIRHAVEEGSDNVRS
jgi:hypothetical protein